MRYHRSATWFVAALLAIILFGCMPAIDTADETDYLNDNPGLTLGECETIKFYSEVWGWEFIEQCVPDGFTLYEQVGNYPIRANHTGAGYTLLPNGAWGRIGFTLPTVQLLPGCYAVKTHGEGQMWGEPRHYNLKAFWSMASEDGSIDMNSHNFNAPGDYVASFYLDAPQLADYVVTVYLSVQYGSATANSYITLSEITVEQVSEAHCN